MDTIGNFLTKIRNAQNAGHGSIAVTHSQMKEEIAKILARMEFIEEATVNKKGKFPELKITLREKRKINLKRISKPGQRLYVKNSEIKKVRNGLGISIISTSQGLMTNFEAKKKKLGGEIVCTIY